MPCDADTIFALSSAPGKAGVAVVRISGTRTKEIIARISKNKTLLPRYAHLSELHHPITQQKMDKALLLFFPAPHSFTGEDVIECHVHGGASVVAALYDALSSLGARMAEAGEFTRRAFLNEKMDLTQAEGLADLIDGETESQRLQALRQMEGHLGEMVGAWRRQLMRILAHVEADIDFADEDLPPDIAKARLQEMQQLIKILETHLNDKRRGERLRNGFSIAIIGPPNAGKSSLLNALAMRDAAIVSARAGTTRDIIEVHLDIDGYAVLLADTAGVRPSDDDIEGEGIARALRRAHEADLKLLLLDAADLPAHMIKLDPTLRGMIDDQTLLVINKTELCETPLPMDFKNALPISVKTGAGMQALMTALSARIKQAMQDDQNPVLITRARHRDALTHTYHHLNRAAQAFAKNQPPELVAEDIRLATRALGRMTGAVDVEDLLDIIFRDFCIGK